MILNYTVRPISDRTWLRPAAKREWSRFDSTWTKTQTLLARELDHLDARGLVFEVDVPEPAIRNDGMLRADARADTPAVVIAFESKHGPQLHRCDKFTARWSEQGPDWQQNARAIALTLEALRAVDRYGAAETGQQYAGFKQLPAGRAMPASHMTSDAALQILADAVTDAGPVKCYPDDIRSGITAGLWPVHRNKVVRAAHPDRLDGDHTRWDQCRDAAETLGVRL